MQRAAGPAPYSQIMRTRPPLSLTFLQERLPESEVTTGGSDVRRRGCLLTGGGGKLRAATGIGLSRFIHEGTSRLAGSRLSVGTMTGAGVTTVPSEVREQAASGSAMQPATITVPILSIPAIQAFQGFADVPRVASPCRQHISIVEILRRKGEDCGAPGRI